MFLDKLKRKLCQKGRDNKGYTLVELIVVIVILAILIGVTIGGIYRYVSKGRNNTDTNNASSMQTALSTMVAEKDVYDWAQKSGSKPILVKWTAACSSDDADYSQTEGAISDTDKTLFMKKIKDLMPDGLPQPKAADHFTIKIDPNGGNPVVSVAAYKDSAETARVAGTE